jgi:hypothetical protein
MTALLNRVRNQIRERNTSEENDDLTALERRLRRRRYTFMDEDAESHDELLNPREEQDYPDFRTYPLTINWKDIYSIKNDSCIYFLILS